jgi:hypothetical protein
VALHRLGPAALAGALALGPPGPASGARAPGRPAPAGLTVTTRSLPVGANGTGYSALVGTAGSLGYCGWSISRGRLPSGLQLALGLGCQAQIVGVPGGNVPGRYPFDVEVYDSTGGHASAALSINMGRRAEVLPVPPEPQSGGRPFTASSQGAGRALLPEWSGYVAAGGPYQDVEGTFNVPYLYTSLTSCQDELAEWVGVNGADTLVPGAGRSLVQAGVSEGMTNPFTGVCRPGQFYLWPWWEVPPKAEASIYSVPVSAGDRVTVEVGQDGPSTWRISLRDDTNGASFTTEQQYSAPARSAEWVVEASEVPGLCWPGVDPQVNLGICQLAPYAPPVTFSGLGLTGHVDRLWRADMVQFGARVASPGPLAGGRFSIAYSGPGG